MLSLIKQVFIVLLNFRVIVNANSVVQYVIQIKNGIIKHVNVNVRIIVSAKKITFGILPHVFVRIVSI